MDRAPGPKRDRRQELERLAGLDLQAISPGDRGQDKHGLHHGEVVADADARPVAEREIGATRQPLDQVVVPALGPEGLGVVEPAAVAVDQPLIMKIWFPWGRGSRRSRSRPGPRGRCPRRADTAASIRGRPTRCTAGSGRRRRWATDRRGRRAARRRGVRAFRRLGEQVEE